MASRSKIENKLNENDKLIAYCLENINDAFNLDFGLCELITNFQYIKNACIDEPIISNTKRRSKKEMMEYYKELEYTRMLFEQFDQRVAAAERERERENSFERLYM